MRVLIEGLGSIAQKHINSLRKIYPSVEIYGLRSSKDSVAYEGITNVYSYQQLSQKPDFIIISNPTQNHRESIKKAIEIKVPLMIEKPVLHNILPEDSFILQKLDQAQIKTYIACNLRFHKILQYLKRYLLENECRINEVNVYCGSYFPDWRPNRNYKEVYSAKYGDGGGIHLELIHELDYTCWLFGIPKLVSLTTSSRSTIEIEAADYAHYVLEYPNYIATITLNFYRKETKRQIEIVFENETWIVDLYNSNIKTDKGYVIYESNFKILDTYDLQISHMINVIQDKEKSINTFQDSMEILKICLGYA